MTRIILASQSPRRQQMLTEAGLIYEVITHDTDESFPLNLPVSDIAQYIAHQKALAVQHHLNRSNDIIISADTIVALGTTLFGKPTSFEEATMFLSSLSGKEHQVITGVCLLSKNKIRIFHSITTVEFYELTEEQISHYIQTYQPYDKAGGYAIQEWIGLVGMKKITGCYFNVVGLPVSTLLRELTLFNQAEL